ncbi:MAG: hypothetical protein KGH95_05290 [Thaumarchaeota archaeon]|nr:hypothetical protein [Nitrososphaerota archaeon]
MQIRLLVLLLVVGGMFVSYPVFGQASPITVQTDKPSYADGNTMIISGKVTDQLNIPISVVIKNGQTPVYIAQADVDPSTYSYSVQAVAGGNLWKSAGTYEIDVTYGGPDKTVKTTFQYTGTLQNVPPTNNATSSHNQTVPAIPEFGPLAAMIFAVSIMATLIFYVKTNHSFRIK